MSGDNYDKTVGIDESLIKGPVHFTPECMLVVSSEVETNFIKLKNTANNTTNSDRNVFPTGVTEFYEQITVFTQPFYKDATDDHNLKMVAFLSFPSIRWLEVMRKSIHKSFNDCYILEQVHYTGNFDRITMGYLPVEDPLHAEEDPFHLKKRISNISGTLKLFDSLYYSVSEMAIINSSVFSPIREQVRNIIDTLKFNRAFLAKKLERIERVYKSKALEAVWFMGDTRSSDLKTKSGTILTLGLGVANMWATDLDNKTIYIPKLFYAVHIYFRPVNKNIKAHDLPLRFAANRAEDFGIISKRTVLRDLCLTAGFTIGSLDKNNFDNFFGGSSLLLGPGYRINRSLLLSTGICFLKRSTLNPLVTEKKFTSGFYASVSIDFDLLGTLGSVTGLLLK